MRIPSWRSVAVAGIPVVGMCLTVPLWDRVQPVVLGLPFNLFWLVAWIPITSVCLMVAHRIESRRDGSE